MLSSNYTDRRLAAVYDALNPVGADTAFYIDLADGEPQNILDVGCGTGMLTCQLVRTGHRVTGVDPATSMLEIARSREGGELVVWLQSDAAGLRSDTAFDLAIMTGHAFQVLLTDAMVDDALTNLRRHLKPGGRLAFETRNPAARAWESWTPKLTRRQVDCAEFGPVNVHTCAEPIDGDIVRFATHFEFSTPDPKGLVATSALRFMPQADVATALLRAGFESPNWYGDWDRSPFHPTSREIIVVANTA